jgi:peptidoglycan biosynthesis protein MviN/MurJ (putative lipid II flippase)
VIDTRPEGQRVRSPADAPAIPESAPPPHRLAGNALVTAGAQLVTMGLGAVLAIVVLFLFGKTAETDGLFTAFGVYNIMAIVAQSLRTTIVARLVEGPSLWEAFDRYVAAVLVLALACAVPLAVLADPLAHLLTGDQSGDAHDTARTALQLFSLAGAAVLLAALGAAALAALDRFVAVSVAYLAAGFASIAAILVLATPLDVTSVAVAVSAGALLNLAIMVRNLLRAGWSPHRRVLARAPGIGRRIWVIVTGAAIYAAPQGMFVVSLALAARMGSGAATVYTYAFFAASFIVGASSSSVSIVLAAPVAQGWDRSPPSLTPHLRTIVRLGATLTVIVIGVAAIAGDDLANLVLGSKLTEQDTSAMAGSFVALAGFMLAMVAVTLPLLAAFALSRYTAVAAVAVGAVLAQVVLGVAAATTDRLEWLALATSGSTIIMLIGLLAVVYGRHAGAPLAAIAAELAPPIALGTATFGVVWAVALAVDGRAGDVALAAVAALGYVAALRALLPAHWELVHRLLAPVAALRRSPA